MFQDANAISMNMLGSIAASEFYLVCCQECVFVYFFFKPLHPTFSFFLVFVFFVSWSLSHALSESGARFSLI